ncbi:mercuric transporter MerT family protein [Paraburkholderia fungorum]|uniref:mercuric transporter MerT family protein n=1 Tax=Paraburkholderia fungorum TaxID=134537 RepID=UPI0038BB15C6
MRPRWSTTGPVLAGAAAALGASAGCAGPLLLVVLGLGGAWGSHLTALRPFQPLFVAISIAFFAVAFRRLHARSEKCTVGEACAAPSSALHFLGRDAGRARPDVVPPLCAALLLSTCHEETDCCVRRDGADRVHGAGRGTSHGYP